MQTRNKRQKLILLSILLLLIFSYPLISIANRPLMVARFPLLYLYIFGAWFITIILLFIITNNIQQKKDE